MALPGFQATIQDEEGNALASPTVEVINENTGLNPSLFSDRNGSTPLGSSGVFTATTEGFAQFFAAPGVYRIIATASGGGTTVTWRYVALWDADAVTIGGVNQSLQAHFDDVYATRQSRQQKPISVTGTGTITPSETDIDAGVIPLTGSSGDDRTIQWPNDDPGRWLIINNDAGGNVITITTNTGTGVIVPAGQQTLIRSDGTNMVYVTTGSPWENFPIGHIEYLPDDLAGVEPPPTDDPRFRYVKLTAGLDGPGQYNEGILTNEFVGGTAPLVRATADVSLAGSPMNGVTLDLLNTENRHLRAGTSPGAVSNDQTQRITGTFAVGSSTGWTSGVVVSDAFSLINPGAYPNIAGGQSGSGGDIEFDSANSPNSRYGDHTDVKMRQVTAYQRIL